MAENLCCISQLYGTYLTPDLQLTDFGDPLVIHHQQHKFYHDKTLGRQSSISVDLMQCACVYHQPAHWPAASVSSGDDKERTMHTQASIKRGLWADEPGESRRPALHPPGALLIGSGHELGKAMIWKP
ncbi:hypothetical protein Pcinc_040452 [Petrolisthes cinctipes]|uniref:Uncharacterized protein n=1 Tax=Petrolisthes cinctipes TaxID=88211 RepID=A0AAE1BLH4_PETCI|nr:hypothetical protein Pcinc_040452 [Petrolisthes cinctipes]